MCFRQTRNIKTKVPRMVKTHILFLWPHPFCTYFERYMLSTKIRAKRVGVIKDKICILKIQDTFVLSRICKKSQGTQIKVFLCFELKGEHKEPHLFVFPSLIPKIYLKDPPKPEKLWRFFWQFFSKTQKCSKKIKKIFLTFFVPFYFMELKGMTLDHNFYVDVGKQCHTENA